MDLLPSSLNEFKDCPNIHFRLEDLFNNTNREAQKEHILSSDFIMIDIDPHEGIMEYEMYEWLRTNKYKGVILWDDIHLKQVIWELQVEIACNSFGIRSTIHIK